MKSRACLFFGDSLKGKKCPKHKGFITACTATKKDTVLLRAFHAENCFLAHSGARSSAVCLPLAHTWVLGHAYFKLRADSKGVFLSTDLGKILASCVLLPAVADDRLKNSLRNERSLVSSFLWDTLSAFDQTPCT